MSKTGFISVTAHEHPDGVRFQESVKPLLIIRGLKLIDVITLEIHTVHPDHLPTYAALSYVWGRIPRNKKTSFEPSCCTPHVPQNESILLDTLPRTLQEAILLTRDLDLRYLWIDELCIDQAHSAIKSTIITYMGAIYAAADIVIVAATGVDASYGLPGTKNHPRQPLARALSAEGHCIEFIAEPRKSFDEQLMASVWSTRGWTYQEMALARRCIVVFPGEIFWVCKGHLQREEYSTPERFESVVREFQTSRMENIGVPSTGVEVFLGYGYYPGWGEYDIKNYYRMIYEYTCRELTFESDRLDAIKGVLGRTSEGHDSVLLNTGLPLKSFGLALTWNINPRMNPKLRTPLSGIPSWSWASAGRPVFYDTELYDDNNGETVMDCFAYETAGNTNNIIARPLSELHSDDMPLDIRAIDSFFQTLVLDPDPPFPIIHLVTVNFRAYLKPAVQGEMDCGWTYRITNFSHDDDIEYADPLRGGVVVDKDRFGPVDTTRLWRFALVCVWSRQQAPTLIFWTLVLRKVGGYYERIGIAALSGSRFVELFQGYRADPRCSYLKLR